SYSMADGRKLAAHPENTAGVLAGRHPGSVGIRSRQPPDWINIGVWFSTEVSVKAMTLVDVGMATRVNVAQHYRRLSGRPAAFSRHFDKKPQVPANDAWPCATSSRVNRMGRGAV
ncbi:MAG: hypothetical protein JWO48_129, partial [Bryobacterales bacterium]|nr:hypothetical protein [Bryobacterales bacterium]